MTHSHFPLSAGLFSRPARSVWFDAAPEAPVVAPTPAPETPEPTPPTVDRLAALQLKLDPNIGQNLNPNRLESQQKRVRVSYPSPAARDTDAPKEGAI